MTERTIDSIVNDFDALTEALKSTAERQHKMADAKKRREKLILDIGELKKKLDAVETEMLEIDGDLRDMLGVAIPSPTKTGRKGKGKTGAAKGENKDKVMEALTYEYQTIEQLEARTGLTKTQVNQIAPKLVKQGFAVRNPDKKGEYKRNPQHKNQELS